MSMQLRHAFFVVSGATPASGNPEYWGGEIPWITPEDLSGRKNYWLSDTRRRLTYAGHQSSGTTIAPAHSIVLSKRAPIGQLALLYVSACSNQGCFLLIPKRHLDSRFFYYWLSSQVQYLKALGSGSTFMELGMDDLKSIYIPNPPLAQQCIIADYLDHETARLDALAAQKERLLKLLTEKRQALITHAITQGLVPMILPSTPTSPSEQNEENTETERDIHNETSVNTDGGAIATKRVSRRRLKYLSTINDESLDEDTDANLEIRYIDIGNVDPLGNTEEPSLYRFGSAPSRARRCVRDGDVIVSTVRTYLQAITQIHDAPDNLVVSTGFAVIRPIEDEFHADYCKYAVRESTFLAEVEKRSVGVSYPAINTTDLANIPVSVHPLSQQRMIADHLDRETTHLDTLMAKVRETIALLGERRAALISAAVTGQIDVGGAG